MGLDLKLLPFDADYSGTSFSHTILSCFRRQALFEAIKEAAARDGLMVVPSGFASYLCRDDEYEESHYGDTLEDGLGEPLQYVEVETLLSLRQHEGVWDNPKNRAIWAYLEELSARTKVALYWD